MSNNKTIHSTIKEQIIHSIDYAENQITKRNWPKAIQCLNNIIKAYGKETPAKAYVLLSISYRLQGHNQKAMNTIQKGLLLHSEDKILQSEYDKIIKNDNKLSALTLQQDNNHIKTNANLLKKLTISLSYYNDSKHIHRHLDIWNQYNDLVRFQIIDDGSMISINKIVDDYYAKNFDLRLYRIEEDIPWNIPGVRNLGVTVCSTPWILICDMDQTFDRSAILKMLRLIENGPGSFYSFARKGNTSTRGTMLISVDDYWKVGGYDEDMIGNYGYNDPLFRKQLEEQNIHEKIQDDIYCTQHSADCTLNRSTKNINAKKMIQKISELPRTNWNVLRFKWTHLPNMTLNQQHASPLTMTKKPEMHCHDELMQDLNYSGFIPDETMMRWFNEEYSTSKHLLTLYSIARGLNAKNIIEIGFGRSSFVLARAAYENKGTLYTCDINDFSYLLTNEERQVVKFAFGDGSKIWNMCETGIDFAFLDFFSIPSLDENFSLNHISHCVKQMKENAIIAIHDSIDERFKLKNIIHILKSYLEKDSIIIELLNLPYNYGLCLLKRCSPSIYGVVSDKHKKKNNKNKQIETGIKKIRSYTNYEDYINHQKKKTLDPTKRAKWLNEEWTIKVNYFKHEFEKHLEFIKKNAVSIGLAARTGQEVFAMKELGFDAIGIDLVPNPPLVMTGDLHNIPFSDSVFDFAFTNAVDHSLFPDKFMSEVRRILKPNGLFLIHISLDSDSDEYGEIVIRNPNVLTELFGDCSVIKSEHMDPWGGMNYRILLRKI